MAIRVNAVSLSMSFITALFILVMFGGFQRLQIIVPSQLPDERAAHANSSETPRIVINNELSFKELALKFKTDKSTWHHYERIYEKYLTVYKKTHFKFLEIGLGCGTPVVGASAHLWRAFFGPSAEIYFIEFDKTCGEAWFAQYGKEVGDL